MATAFRDAQVRAAAHRGATTPAEPLPQRVGRWQLVGLVGQGSWTRVFQARPSSCSPDRPADYAVKMLRPERARDPVAMRMLQREDLVGRKVTHPHLAPVLSSRIDRPPFFLVMPLLQGASLARRLRGPIPLSVPHALWLARQTAEALAALHEEGWLHGDVKPSNLFVSPLGHVTLIDLGFARLLSDRVDPHAVPVDNLPVAATPAYAAPELHGSEPQFTAAIDTYSLGVTLFEMICGRTPFPALDPVQLTEAHCRQSPPDVREFAPHVPRVVARMIDEMLRKDPAARPHDRRLIDRLVDLEIRTFHLRG